jgi:hypothetical protein
MPNPQQYYQRQVSPNPTAGNVMGDTVSGPSPSEVYRTGLSSQRVYGELERAGNMLTDLGVDAYKQIEQAEYHDQLSKAKLGYLQGDVNFKDSLSKNADTSTWQSKLEDHQKTFRGSLQIKNKRASDDFELWLKANEAEQKHYVNTQKLGTDARNFADNFNASIKIHSDLAAQAPDDKAYQKQVIETAGEYGLKFNPETKGFEPIPDWDNETLVGTPETRGKLFELWLNDTNGKRAVFIEKAQKAELESRKNSILAVATTIRNKETGKINFNAADAFINEQPDVPGEDKIKLKDFLRKTDAQEADNDKRAWDVWQGKQDAELDKMFSTHDYTGGLKVIDAADSGLKGEYSTKQLEWKAQKRALFNGALKGDVALNIKRYADISRRIQTAKTDEEFNQIVTDIADGTGKEWDGTKAAQLIDDVTKYRAPDSTLKTPTAQLYSGKLMDLYSADLNPENINPDLDVLQDYDEKRRKWEDFCKKEPEATAARAREFYENLVSDKKDNDTNGILTGLLNMSPVYNLLRLSPAGQTYTALQIYNQTKSKQKQEPDFDIFGKGNLKTSTVRIQTPDGKIWNVPEDKVDAAIKRGGKRI